MPTISPIRLSRRALLSAAGCGAATLLPGCGGSPRREEDLPEAYAEAYRINLSRAEGESVGVRALTVTPAADLLLATETQLFDN
ncbi:MAG: hypothetical protein H7Y38_09505, partial [Armatimonadetes bacterium]|nr:hypothetical protein [Armatimonadota bacterium]